MLESIQFHNFKALRDTTLPLGQFTLIVGPNGSGKSTALQGLQALQGPRNQRFSQLATAGIPLEAQTAVEVTARWAKPIAGALSKVVWGQSGGYTDKHTDRTGHRTLDTPDRNSLAAYVNRVRVYSLDARSMSQPVGLNPQMELDSSGRSLAGVLDRLRDEAPERFEALNEEFARWLPEFDQILFDTPSPGNRGIKLRTTQGQHAIAAADVSQGTLLALAILTLAYLPEPPSIVGLEEPDRGIHPRLLRDVRDALYRLAYPDQFGEEREPVQVIATTHSPYMLDLFRDRPEEVVIAHKEGQEARFERLSDRPDVDQILQDAHLGDLWYSGVLGGVPGER